MTTHPCHVTGVQPSPLMRARNQGLSLKSLLPNVTRRRHQAASQLANGSVMGIAVANAMIRAAEHWIRRVAGPHAARLETFIRYYGVGLINTAFGYGMFAALIFIGSNLYVAQILSTVSGTAFNYFTYSRHVFRDSHRFPLPYIATYAINYLVGLSLLAFTHHFVKSPYLAGFLALLVASVINFFILRRFAFPARRQSP